MTLPMTREQAELAARNLPGLKATFDGDCATVCIRDVRFAAAVNYRRGPGDILAAFLKRLGFRQSSCGCARRQAALNRWWFKFFR